jgi:hypothetical protein
MWELANCDTHRQLCASQTVTQGFDVHNCWMSRVHLEELSKSSRSSPADSSVDFDQTFAAVFHPTTQIAVIMAFSTLGQECLTAVQPASQLWRNVSCPPEAGNQPRAWKKRRFVPVSQRFIDHCRTRCRLFRGSSASSEVHHHSPFGSSSTLSKSHVHSQRVTTPQRTKDSPDPVVDGDSTLMRWTDRVAGPADPSTSDFSKVFSHICQGYDPSAPHFDGLLGASSSDFLIDLDTDSMER